MVRYRYFLLNIKSRAIFLACSLAVMGCDKNEPSSSPTAERSASTQETHNSNERPGQWAMALEGKEGLPNFFKVSDALYRGAQPEEIGFETLKALGIKTVVNLRTYHSDRKICERVGLDYVKISMQAWEGEDDEVADFLNVVNDPQRHPVFVHCQHGADRTGTVCAIYRIMVQGWSKADAIKEMTEGGYGFHAIWENLIEYIRNLDIEAIQPDTISAINESS